MASKKRGGKSGSKGVSTDERMTDDQERMITIKRTPKGGGGTQLPMTGLPTTPKTPRRRKK